MSLQLRLSFTIVGLVLIAGCGSQVSQKERLEKTLGHASSTVVPTSGQVTVDGEPADGLAVLLYSADGKTRLAAIAPAITKSDGKFSFTTYQAGDGLEPGDYKVTFDWRTYKQSDGSFSGQDKLKGLYNSPKKSDKELKVTEGEPQKDLHFDLVTKK